MDELNDKDVPVSYTPEATVTVSEHGTVETPLDSGVCMSSDQVQGSSAEGAQSCNGEDIMVEVLGTSVYVGGVCTSEGGERSNNEGGQDASANVSAGEDRAVNSSVEADAIPVNESFVQDAGVSDSEVSKSYGSGNEVEESLGSSELVEEERAKIAPTEVVAVIKREETVTVEEVAVEDIGRVEDTVEVGGKAKDVEMETFVDGSFVVSSSIVETIVVHARAGEEGAIPSGEGENLKVEVGDNTGHEGEKDMGVNSGQELVANAEKISENENAHKVEGLGEALIEPRDMNEVGGSSAEAGAPGETFAGEGENLKVDMGASTGQEGEKDAVVHTDQEPGASRDKVDEDENAHKVEGLGNAVTEPGDKNEVTGSSIGAPGETLAVESGKGLTVEAMEEDTKMADEVVEAPNDLKTLKDNEVHNSDIEATVVPSSATAGDLCGQMQVQAEKTAVVNRDKVGENENAPKVEGLGEAVMEPGDKNKVRSSSIGAPGETLAVESGKGLTVEAMEEDTKMADEVVEAPNDLKTLKDKKVQNPDLEAKVVPSSATAGDLSGQMQIQVEKTAVAPTVCEEDLNAKKPLDEQSNVFSVEEVAVMDNGDPPCSEVSAMETDAIGEQDTSHPGDDQLLKTGDIGCGTGNLGLVHTQTVGNPLSSEVSAMETDAVGEQDASHPGDDQLRKTKEIGRSTENLGHVHTQTVGGPLSSEVSAMETDAVGEQDTNHPGDDQPMKTGEIGGSNENPGHVHAHSMPSCLPNEVVAGADLAEKKSQVFSVLEDIKRVEPEVCTDSNVASDIARVESSIGGEKEVDNQNSNLQQIGSDGGYEKVLVCDNEVPISADRDQPLESEEYLEKSVLDGAPPLCSDMMPEEKVQELHQGQEVLVEGQHEKGENVDGISKNEHQEHVDEKSSLQPTQFVEAEVTASDGNVLLKPNVDQFSKIDTVQGSIEIDANIACSGDIDQMDSEEVPKPATELSAPSENDEKLNFEDSSAKEVASDITALEGSAAYETGLEGVTDADKVYLHGEQDYEVATEAPEQTIMNEEKSANLETLLPETSPIDKRPGYELPLENDGMFSVSDLVWGKVKSHPWWPGQIFDFTDASEKAMKYHKNDCLLVAYFGDRTFAWNEVSSLKPFRTYFSQMEKQCNSEKFQNAINCALEEVSRRVQLGLSHSCLPEEAYEKIKFQSVENVGICQESSIRDGSDGCAYIDLLEADKLIEYVKALAKFPSAGSDRLELAIAKAQLLAFNRLNGHFSLPEYLFDEGPMETDAEASLHENNNYSGEVIEPGTSNCENAEYASSGQEMLKSQKSLSHKRKHDLKDGGYPKSKERSMSELMGVESPDYDNLTAKRLRGNDHSTDAKVSSSSPPVPKPSFKIGECIRRVASQLTGTPVKSNNERGDISLQSEDANRGVAVDPMEYSSLDELLSQLQLAAQEPLEEYHFLDIIVNFFSDFRNSIIQGQYSGTEPLSMDKVSGKRKKFLKSTGGFPEAFEFDDMNDTYWTDRVIQNGSEEPLPRRNRKKENQIVLVQPEKRLQENHRRSYSRKQYSNANQPLAVETPVEYVDKNAPAELIMNFSEGRSAPSETNLNKMFRRFGPIKEIETEVDKESGRARVVFKKASDAEVAFNSAGKFKIFGPKLVVSYELNYSPTAPFKACSVPTIHDHHEMQLDLSTHDHEMQLGFSTNGHEMQLDLSGHDMQLDLSADDHEMQLDLSNFETSDYNEVRH